MTRPVSDTARRRLLQLMLSRGLIMADIDHRVLRDLERRRHAHAHCLHSPSGRMILSLAFSITPKGQAWLQGQPARVDARQTDIEDAIASASSGDRPEAAPLTDLDAPAIPAADVSAPKAAQSKRALAAAKPEPAHV